MSGRVKPALTPEEWRYVAENGCVPHDGGDGFPQYGNRHMTAAIALYGQPFGFTHEDVRQLRRLAESRVCHGHGEYGPPDMYERAMGGWRGLNDLADRIAALLPPEGKE